MNDETAPAPGEMPSHEQVRKAIKLTYAQMMLAAVFAASTGGMFLIGFAIKLGANNIVLGLLSTIPACAVVFQFGAAWLVQRGVSRKKLTVLFGLGAPLCWLLIAVIPFFHNALGQAGCLIALIGVVSLAALAAQCAGNARGSWVGELIPDRERGRFFGFCGMFAGIVGSTFAIIEGRSLDYLKARGLVAFTGLFFFGVVFGLVVAILNLPQPDCPLPGGRDQQPYLQVLASALRNKDLVRLARVHAVLAMAGIASPFIATYWLRDLKFGFFPLGILNSLTTGIVLASSPFWGRTVDRWGCRPVLIIGCMMSAPCALLWLLIPRGVSLAIACLVLALSAIPAGLGAAAVSISISSMLYRVSRPEGRSIQFAAYSSFVTLMGAPMPTLGGWLVTWMGKTWTGADLRVTFYIGSLFLFAAAAMARRLHEPTSTPVRTLLFDSLPRRISSGCARLGRRAV